MIFSLSFLLNRIRYFLCQSIARCVLFSEYVSLLSFSLFVPSVLFNSVFIRRLHSVPVYRIYSFNCSNFIDGQIGNGGHDRLVFFSFAVALRILCLMALSDNLQ